MCQEKYQIILFKINCDYFAIAYSAIDVFEPIFGQQNRLLQESTLY